MDTTQELGEIFETLVHANKKDDKGRGICYVVGMRDNGTDFYAWVQNARYFGNGKWIEFGTQQRSRKFTSQESANLWAYGAAKERIAKIKV